MNGIKKRIINTITFIENLNKNQNTVPQNKIVIISVASMCSWLNSLSHSTIFINFIDVKKMCHIEPLKLNMACSIILSAARDISLRRPLPRSNNMRSLLLIYNLLPILIAQSPHLLICGHQEEKHPYFQQK